MASNWRTDFRFIISLRLLLIFLTMIGLCWLWQQQPMLIFSLMGLSMILLLQIALLFQSLQKIYSQLEDFFICLRFQDTTRQTIPVFHQGKKLAQLWQEIQTDIQQLRERNESLLHYYSALLEKVPVPLVRIQDNHIELLNIAAQHLFQRNQLRSCDELSNYGEAFAQLLLSIKPGEQQLATLQSTQQSLSLAVSATSIQRADGISKIISLQVIQRELDRQQINAWQRLVQVLSHEIMNSMTPISSLSRTAQDLLLAYQQEPSPDLLIDANEALTTVNRRSEHLMDFVHAYRTVTQPVAITLRTHSVRELLHTMPGLFAVELRQYHIDLTIEITPDHLEVQVDIGQIEQVLINLVKNAIEALQTTTITQRKVQLRAYLHQQGQLIIDITDNGPGIPNEQREQIFVPFYTSKRTGTGIGLFIVQQIMHAHGGSINYIAQSPGSCFRLTF